MSQEKAELTKDVFEAFNRRDPSAFVAPVYEDVNAGPAKPVAEGNLPGHQGRL